MLIPRDEVIRQNARLNQVRDEIIAELMQYPGVIAVSDGVKRIAGTLVPEICIKVIVEKKKEIKDIPESERIPTERSEERRVGKEDRKRGATAARTTADAHADSN